MKVLFVFSIGRLDSGVAVVWMNLLRGLPARGVDPYVVMPQNPDSRMRAELDSFGIPWEVVPFAWWATRDAASGPFGRRVRRGVARALNARAEKRIGKIIDARGIELLYLCDGTIATGLAAANKRDLPVVWHIHEFMRTRPGGLNFVTPEMHVGSMLAKADRIITVTKSIRTDLTQQFPGLRDGRMQVVYNGVLPSRIVDKRGILDRDATVFTLVGHINENEGQEEAVRAFIRIAPDFPEAKLRIVGTGDETLLSRLRSIADKSKAATRIVFANTYRDITDIWNETDVALNCSYSEGCSMAFCEAMSSGCLMLCSTAESNVELVEGKYGLLYERRKIEALAERMRWVLTHKDEARAIAAAGKRRALGLFGLDRQLDSVSRVFSEAMR